jgi:hypothetical protein
MIWRFDNKNRQSWFSDMLDSYPGSAKCMFAQLGHDGCGALRSIDQRACTSRFAFA